MARKNRTPEENARREKIRELLVRHIFTMAQSSWPNPDNLLFPSKTGTYIDMLPKRQTGK